MYYTCPFSLLRVWRSNNHQSQRSSREQKGSKRWYRALCTRRNLVRTHLRATAPSDVTLHAHCYLAWACSLSCTMQLHACAQECALLFYSSTLPVPNRAIPSPCTGPRALAISKHIKPVLLPFPLRRSGAPMPGAMQLRHTASTGEQLRSASISHGHRRWGRFPCGE